MIEAQKMQCLFSTSDVELAETVYDWVIEVEPDYEIWANTFTYNGMTYVVITTEPQHAAHALQACMREVDSAVAWYKDPGPRAMLNLNEPYDDRDQT